MSMEISTEDLAGGITKIVLDGRLDIAGASAVDLKMNLIAGNTDNVLIDLQKVSFIGSMGVRTLVTPARTIQRRGGKVVLFAPTELVEAVLKTSGIDAIFPIHHELGDALAALQ
jgi:anti-anti-sigma factor